MAVLVFAATLALLSLTAWSRWMKPLWFGVVLLAAVVQHYMLSYRIVMDPTMVANVMQTDTREARDLLSVGLVINVLWVSALPALWLARLRLRPMPLWSQLWRNILLLVAALALGLGGALLTQRELAPLMRNHVQLRYMMNPVASLYSTAAAGLKPFFRRSGKLMPITAGAALGASYASQARPPLFVLVVGETARADHFALNGYARDTTPELAARDVLSWRNVHSCGTNTLASVPCMFSSLGRDAYEARKDEYENLLDVLQAAGLAVFWLDNQAGCKDVCARVPNASAATGLDAATQSALCDGSECMDEVMLHGLDARIAALAPERRAKGVVLVMHQMGSHGPAYYKRSTPALKRFMPECKTNALAECSHDELVNAYDNSIAYTDYFLGRTIDWLKSQYAGLRPGPAVPERPRRVARRVRPVPARPALRLRAGGAKARADGRLVRRRTGAAPRPVAQLSARRAGRAADARQPLSHGARCDGRGHADLPPAARCNGELPDWRHRLTRLPVQGAAAIPAGRASDRRPSRNASCAGRRKA